jgi:RNA polymerase sigma-70 factor, ECF subfamily
VEKADFRALYEHFLPLVGRWVTRLGIPQEALDDVVQEIFLTIYGKIGQFEGRSPLRSWVFGVTIRVTRNFRRKRTTGPAGEDGPIDAVADDVGDPEAVAEQTEALTLLQQILNELDVEKREVFVLAELEQLSAPEIATLLEISSNTVASRLRLAREEVRASWARAQARDEWRLR